jgi:hypothetical protein
MFFYGLLFEYPVLSLITLLSYVCVEYAYKYLTNNDLNNLELQIKELDDKLNNLTHDLDAIKIERLMK